VSYNNILRKFLFLGLFVDFCTARHVSAFMNRILHRLHTEKGYIPSAALISTCCVLLKWSQLISTRSSAVAERPRVLRVIEYFVVTQNHSKWHTWEWRKTYVIVTMYLIPFLIYSVLNNSVTMKSGFGVVQGNWKWRRLVDYVRLSIGRPL